MALSPGTRLGPYEILSTLGAGGMGEVYHARDTRLNRAVAVKVLKGGFSERFQREARIISGLNHPHICSVYDIGRDAGTDYFVMELLEGETLAVRLARSRLPLQRCLRIGIEIASALNHAHRHGIVHRDLKPSNVVLTDSGAKLLDFGIAKQQSSLGPSAETIPVLETAAGTLLGTPAYMAPEQISGDEADARTDIWAMGCVLYEATTGRRAFDGENLSTIIRAVLEIEPEPLRELQPLAPSLLQHVVHTCLAKDPEERWQSAADVKQALQWLAGEPLSLAAGGTLPGNRRQSLRSVAVILASLAAGAAVGALATREWLRLHGAPVALTPTFVRITDQPGAERAPSLSPDGKTVVYVSDAEGNDDVYLIRIGGRNPINLTADSPAAESTPVFSPDGSHLAFRSERSGGGIFVMGATGESIRRVMDFGFDPSWSPDGKSIAVGTIAVTTPFERTGNGRLWAVDVATGEGRELRTTGDAMQPSWSPTGTRIAYWGIEIESGIRDLWTVRADGTGDPVRVTADAHVDWHPVWAADGKHLYFLSDRGGVMNLWRVAIDESSGVPLQGPEAVTTPTQFITGLSVRSNNSLVFSAAEPRSTLQLIHLDSTQQRVLGPPIVLLQSPRRIRWLDLSPDGEWILFSASDPGDNLYVIGTDGSRYRQITWGNWLNRGGRWGPDGSRIFFYSNRSGIYQGWHVRFDGSGLQQFTSIPNSVVLPVLSASADKFAFMTTNPAGRDEVHIGTVGALPGTRTAAAAVERLTEVVHKTPSPDAGILIPGSWSPDGMLLAAYLAPPDRRLFVYSASIDRLDDLHAAGQDPRWLPDGRRLMFHDSTRILVIDTANRRTHSVLEVPARTHVPNFGFALSLNGRRIALVVTEEPSDIWLMSFN